MTQQTLPTPNSATEQVIAIKANDEKTLRNLYQSNYARLELYVLANSGTAEQAKDVYQEAFIAVWRNIQLDKFTPASETALSAYLFRIAKNKWMDQLRSGHNKVVSFEQVTEEIPQESLREHDHLEAVHQNFKKLGANCREVLSMFYYNKQSLKTIANTFDWTEATARNNKYRCLQHLRELLKKQKNH